MQEHMSEDLRAVALRSKRFKRFLESCSLFSESLEIIIRCELAKFWVWASQEVDPVEAADSVEVLKGRSRSLTGRLRGAQAHRTGFLLSQILFGGFFGKKQNFFEATVRI